MHCSRCAIDNPSHAKFCMECGRPLVSAREPRDYTPRHLADKILGSRHTMRGARKWVTVLFVDINESVNLAGLVDAEVWHEVMDGFFEMLAEAVHRFEGTINQYTGDGIMALFGAPIAHEDHAQRGCLAALRIRDRSKDYADLLRRERNLNFSIRIGLHSGELIVGAIGDDLRMDYTAQGQEVALAARVEHVAAADSIYMTGATQALVEEFMRTRDLGEFSLKGFRRAVPIFELVARGEARSRWEASLLRGLSRFVGREAEIDSLLATAKEVERDGPCTVLVVSDAGLGKSRLCYEFAERCVDRGWLVTRAQCLAHGYALPYAPIIQLLRDYFGIEQVADRHAARERIAGRLVMIDERLRKSMPLVFEFLGLKETEFRDPDLKQELLVDLLRRMMTRGTQRQPALILVEDLQWMDEQSERFLQRISNLDSARVLFLFNHRPEYRSPWERARTVQLRPLAREAALELLQGRCGRSAALGQLHERILAQTAGNPFYLEEVIRALIADGTLEGDPGNFHLTRDVKRIAIPPSVYSLIAARIDRLDEEAKALLEVAAVIGENFDSQLLSQVAEVAVAPAVSRLESNGFLEPSAPRPAGGYQFRHPLIREVAYRTQLRERRARTHRMVAGLLVSRMPKRGGDKAALLAYHWRGAGDMQQAVSWCKTAAEWAMSRDLSEAYRYFSQLVEWLDQTPEIESADSLRLAAQTGLIEVGWRLTKPLPVLREIFDAAAPQAHANPFAATRLLSAFAMAEVLAGDIENAIGHLTAAEQAAAQSGSVNLRANVQIPLAYCYSLSGRLAEAEQLMEQCLNQIKDPQQLRARTSEFNPRVWLRGMRAVPRVHLGRYAEALQDIEVALRAADEAEDLPSAAAMHGIASLIGWLMGDSAAATDNAEKQMRVAERIGGRKARAGASDSVGLALSMRQRYDEAVAMHEASLSIVRETGALRQSEPVVLANLAWARLGVGDTHEASVLAAEGVDIARTRGTPVSECRGLLILARCHLGGPDESNLAAARKCIDSALDIVKRTGGRCFESFLRIELARYFRYSGDRERCDRERARALAGFNELGVTPHAALLAGGAPKHRGRGSNIP